MNRKYKITRFSAVFFLIAWILAVITAFPAFAAGSEPLLVDNSNLLTDDEKDMLETALEDVSTGNDFDAVILTVDDLNGKTATEYADDYYDEHNYGYGDRHDGILFLICLESRDWEISTTGYGITAFTDAGIEYISNEILPSLSSGNYSEAFTTFADEVNRFVIQAKTGNPYDVGNLPESKANPWGIGAVCAALGSLISFFMNKSEKSKLTSTRAENQANNYRTGAIAMALSQDAFSRETHSTSFVPSSGGGGSSTHFGSSGTTHGGSSGKF